MQVFASSHRAFHPSDTVSQVGLYPTFKRSYVLDCLVLFSGEMHGRPVCPLVESPSIAAFRRRKQHPLKNPGFSG